MSNRDGGPAFPAAWTNDGDRNTCAPDGQICPPGYTVQIQGMSLRDYFAATVLQGMLANSDPHQILGEPEPETISATAYRFADAMLAERNKS